MQPAPKNLCRILAYVVLAVLLNFPFVFWYTDILVFFYTDAIETIWKSIPWNRKSSCVLSEKDRQVIKTTPARLWSRARKRPVETDHISFLPSKQIRLHSKVTRWNDHNEKTEIGVAAETSGKKLWNERNNAVNWHFFNVMGTCFRGNFHVDSLLCYSQTLRDSRCSSLCSAHGWLKDPSNLAFKLIITLIWNIRSPFKFRKCRNSRGKTINIPTIDAITIAPGLWTSSEG